jgi:hypothetical protein
MAIGVTLRGVQRFWYRGVTHDSTPGHAIVIRPRKCAMVDPAHLAGTRVRNAQCPMPNAQRPTPNAAMSERACMSAS